MKYGRYLKENQRPEWKRFYLDYSGLKDLIKECADNNSLSSFTPRVTSLSVQRPDLKDLAPEEKFYKCLDDELSKIGDFTGKQMATLRERLNKLMDDSEAYLSKAGGSKGIDKESAAHRALMEAAKKIGDEYLAMEKYVNLNYMGFHKILKKHDKNCPNNAIKPFYISRLHQQPWVQGNFSDVLVSLSSIYSLLRGDASGQKNEDSAQGFVRSTTKYWVRTSDVSLVKHFILQHLPVFQFDKNNFSGDAQLINSVYFDNSNLELYHGRLDKRPGAIALRLRWYGNGEPEQVFVERKTHKESWKGEESVKERFIIPEEKVMPFLKGGWTLEMAQQELRDAGKNEKEIAKFSELFREVHQAVDAKQLTPMVRTQYMRTAFQIPFDATVRVSLDTNMCMIKENPDDGPTCLDSDRWYRDPNIAPTRTEITRFPHAILEIKLSLPDGEQPPQWVQELLASGYLTEVHKFSKFIHGTATLLPDMVQAVPYWIDDESLRPSIQACAPDVPASATNTPQPRVLGPQVDEAGPSQTAGIAMPQAGGASGEQAVIPNKPRRKPRDDGDLRHPLLGSTPTLQLIHGRPPQVGAQGGSRENPGLTQFFTQLLTCCGLCAAADVPAAAGPAHDKPRKIPMRIEPKTYFANERTFLNWIHMSIVVGTIASALLGLSGQAEGGAEGQLNWSVALISMVMLPVAIMIAVYALYTFYWRMAMIRRREVSFFDDKYGPLVLAGVIVFALSIIFVVSLIDFVQMLS
ncbi:unnamed protein product [Pedinophyceae sp. YPF-701]|nr:unnamed protein product [Pedinophyceae sp. YPF-701]